jgi:hypothetical protein
MDQNVRAGQKGQLMAIGTLALIFGIVFIAVGLAGFGAAPPPPDAPPLVVNQGHGLMLGMFPVNILHNAVHLLFGVLGLMASRGILLAARSYFQFVAVAYGLLTVLGLLPATQTTFGLIPIHGNDVWLHALLAVAAGVIGFAMPARTAVVR